MAIAASDLAALTAWARAKPFVRRVWIFGSRARGTHRPDSDLDVAVEHEAMRGDSDPFTTAISEKDNWVRELARLLSAPLDLQSHIPGLTPIIQAGLEASSVLVYERHGLAPKENTP